MIFKKLIYLLLLITVGCSNQNRTDNNFRDTDKSNEWNQTGFELNEVDLHQEALTAFINAIDMNPYNSKAWYNKGYSLYKLGNQEEAIKAYDKAIKLSYKSPDVRLRSLTNKCNSLMILNKLKRALTTCEKAIKTRSNFIFANYNKGVILYRLNRFKESLAVHEKVVSLDPSNTKAWIYISIINAELNNDEVAYNSYKRVSELDPTNPEA